MPRALVTGASGFLGLQLMKALTTSGWDVTAEGLEGLRPADGLSGMAAGRVDVVFHAAAFDLETQENPPGHALLPQLMERSRNLIDACCNNDTALVVCLSDRIYGYCEGIILEDDAQFALPLGDRLSAVDLYARYLEGLCREVLQTRVPFLLARLFGVFGPGMSGAGRADSVQGVLMGLAGDEAGLELSPRALERSCLYIEDAARCVVGLAESLIQRNGLEYDCINVGSDRVVDLNALRRWLTYGFGETVVPSETGCASWTASLVSKRTPDITRLRNLLGDPVQTPLAEALEATARAFGLKLQTSGDIRLVAEQAIPAVKVEIRPDHRLMSAMRTVLWSGRLSNDGPVVRRLEHEAAEYLGHGHVLAVTNGAVALELAIAALTSGHGKAILPAYTFAATLNAVVRAGLEPVFCDIDANTLTMDPDHLQRLLEVHPGVSLVVPVNVFGVAPDLNQIGQLARRAGAKLVLDNAHGFGTEVNGSRLSSEPDASTFSLHATKSVAAGEGGLIVVRDEALARELRQIRNHGLSPRIEDRRVGTNAKLPELSAVLALHGMRGLPAMLERRRGYALRLRRALEECGGFFRPQVVPDGMKSNFESLGAVCKVTPSEMPDVVAAFGRRGIEARRYFWPCLAGASSPGRDNVLPVTEANGRTVVCLPLHGWMDERTLGRIELASADVARELAAGVRGGPLD